MSKIGWPVIKAKAIFLTGKQGDFGDARKRSIFGRPTLLGINQGSEFDLAADKARQLGEHF